MILGIIGFIMILLESYFEDGILKKILELNQLIFWSGICSWALGNMQAQAAKNHNDEKEDESMKN